MRRILFVFCILLIVPTLATATANSQTTKSEKTNIADIRIVQLYNEMPKQIDLSFVKEIPVYIPDVPMLPVLNVQTMPIDRGKISGNENIVKNYPGYLVIENQSDFDSQYPVEKRRYDIDDTFLNVWSGSKTMYASNQIESTNEINNFLEKRVSELYDGKTGSGLIERISILSPFQDYKINGGEPVNIGNSQIGQLTGVGGYKLTSIETLRGIPLLCGISWAYALSGDAPTPDGIPFELLCESRYMIFYYSSQYYNIKCYSIYQEVGERLEDIPICSFEKIVESIEQQHLSGIVDQVYSIRLGYVVFADPECQDPHNREEARKYVYVAVPSWVVECSLNGYDNCNFSDVENTDYTANFGYYRMIINAQTGEVYDRFSQSPNKYVMPKIER